MIIEFVLKNLEVYAFLSVFSSVYLVGVGKDQYDALFDHTINFVLYAVAWPFIFFNRVVTGFKTLCIAVANRING